jgi:hypothetical protein
MEVVGVMPGDELAVSLLERLNEGEGAAAGSFLGLCGQSLICVGAVIVPAMVGLAAGELARENTEQEEAAITKAFGQPFVQDTLRDDIVRTARDSAGQLIHVFDSQVQGDADTILKIESGARGLIGGNLGFPERKGLIFYMTVRVRLIQQVTKKELYAGQIEYLGRTMPLTDWGANDAQRLREQFDLASHELAEKIVDTIFLLYRFTEPDLH